MERIEAASNTVEMLIDILDRALEVGLLFYSVIRQKIII